MRFAALLTLCWATTACTPEAPPPAEPVVVPAPKGTPAPERAPLGVSGLERPAPKPCLAPPTGEGMADEGIVSSQGLGYDAIAGVMRAFVPNTLRCAPPDDAPSGTLEVAITVACDGTVAAVEVVDDGGLAPAMVKCVRETLTFAEFPAHDLPDGETFRYPLTYTF